VRLRVTLTTLSATALLAGSVAAVPAANAAKPGCVIKDVTPHELVIGGRAPTATQFEVDTTCPVEADVNWYLTVRDATPGPYGWLLRANFYQPPWSRYQWAPGGVVGLGTGFGSYLGENQLGVTAYAGEPATSTPMGFSRTLTVKLGTTFDGRGNPAEHFDAVPESVAPGGTLTLTGHLEQAKLDAGEYESDLQPLAAPVVVQYRADGASRYGDVKTVQAAADGSVRTTVTAKRSGTWRLRYAGDATHAATKSIEDHVTVSR
jgi:hypothetical protein